MANENDAIEIDELLATIIVRYLLSATEPSEVGGPKPPEGGDADES